MSVYFGAATALEEVLHRRRSIKSAVLSRKEPRRPTTYALVAETLKFLPLLRSLAAETGLEQAMRVRRRPKWIRFMPRFPSFPLGGRPVVLIPILGQEGKAREAVVWVMLFDHLLGKGVRVRSVIPCHPRLPSFHETLAH